MAACGNSDRKATERKSASSGTTVSKPSDNRLSTDEFNRFYRMGRDFFESHLSPGQFSGAILLARKGQVVFERYAGYRSRETGEQVTPETSFHLASVSKTFTGMAICKLWEEGKLQLDDLVSGYLEGFNYPGITVKHLLNHRSGLPNYVHVLPETFLGTNLPVQNKDVLRFLIENRSRLGAGIPDRRFDYCNTNYALLALIVEKVSGLSFPDYLNQVFFKPIGMNNTFVCTSSSQQESFPSYTWRKQKEKFTFLDLIYGDKNIYSTVRDLLKWDSTLTYGSLFKPETLQAAYSGYSYERRGIKNYGLGWRLYIYPDNRKIVYHNGWWHGNNTVFARLIQDSATVIILGNTFNRRIYQAPKLYAEIGAYEMDESED